ncbi:hypothetical protein [Bosea psychrotolerans]|uniref:Uncharacterized protein n=1 Tax=Bosea psychrotolerans TaxID=1871628 RepID=A0A2S4MHY5_9HYPH|nr:hypothetical protein [Bosea psychrotolerans]POR54340.1 hypothetical protein CYD53_103444 [Bosea psychrotolerans]
MTGSGWIARVLLALVGVFAAAFVSDELIGGGALGWTAGGAILGVTVAPLLLSLIAWRREQDSRSGR